MKLIIIIIITIIFIITITSKYFTNNQFGKGLQLTENNSAKPHLGPDPAENHY